MSEYGDPYGTAEKTLSLKDKKGKSLYKRKGKDIVPSDDSYVYPGFSIDRHASENKAEAKRMTRGE